MAQGKEYTETLFPGLPMADDKFKGEVLAAWSARIKSSAWQRQVSYIDKAVRGQLWSIHKKRYARATLQDDLVKVANQLKMELQCQGIEWGTQEAQKHTQKIVQQRVHELHSTATEGNVSVQRIVADVNIDNTSISVAQVEHKPQAKRVGEDAVNLQSSTHSMTMPNDSLNTVKDHTINQKLAKRDHFVNDVNGVNNGASHPGDRMVKRQFQKNLLGGSAACNVIHVSADKQGSSADVIKDAKNPKLAKQTRANKSSVSEVEPHNAKGRVAKTSMTVDANEKETLGGQPKGTFDEFRERVDQRRLANVASRGGLPLEQKLVTIGGTANRPVNTVVTHGCQHQGDFSTNASPYLAIPSSDVGLQEEKAQPAEQMAAISTESSLMIGQAGSSERGLGPYVPIPQNFGMAHITRSSDGGTVGRIVVIMFREEHVAAIVVVAILAGLYITYRFWSRNGPF